MSPTRRRHGSAATLPGTRPWLAALLAAAVPLAACARELPPPPAAGDLVYRSGQGQTATAPATVVPGPRFERPAILAPVQAPAWQGQWVEREQTRSPLHGAGTGLLLGLTASQIGPVAVLFWPAAVGLVAGAAVLGAAGGLQPDPDPSRFSTADREAIAAATLQLRPDALLQKYAAEVLAARSGRAVDRIPWEPGSPPASSGSAQEADGLLELAIELLGLTAIEEADVFGILLQVRARLWDAQSGALRYERVLIHGPTAPLPDLPRPPVHSLDILAMDNARAYRHQVAEIVRHVARVIAADPALPVANR